MNYNKTPIGFARQLLSSAAVIVLVGLACAVILGAGMLCLRLAGRHLGIRWLADADLTTLKLLSAAFILLPVTVLVVPRIKTRAGVDAEAARQREIAQWRADRAVRLRWLVPSSVGVRQLPLCALVVAVFYVVTLVVVSAVLGTANLITHLRHQPVTEPALGTALKCANVVGVTLSLVPILFLLLGVRGEVALADDEIVERFGSLRKTYSYRTITRCRIEPSERVRSLRCLAFSTAAAGERVEWHRFEFGPTMPVGAAVEFLKSRGLAVEIVGSEDDDLGRSARPLGA